MADQALAVQITAVDRFSAELSKFKQALEKTGVPVDKLGKATEKLKPSQGLATMGKAFGDIGTTARDAAEGLARIVPPLGMITGAASLAGMAKLVSAFGDWGTKLSNSAARVGVAVGDLQAFRNAARLAGVSGEAAAGGFRTLTDTIRDAAGGRNPEAIGWFRALGVSMTDASGHARSASDMLPELADKIAAIKNPSDQARVAVALFGGAGEEMLPFLRRGADGMRELQGEARRLGATNQAGVEAADRFRMSQERVQLAVEGLGYAVAARLAPALTPLLDKLADWVANHSGAIADAIGRIADGFVSWVQGGGLDRVGTMLDTIATTINTVVQAMGGWQTAGEAALAYFAGKWALGMLGTFAKVASAMPGAAAGAGQAASVAGKAGLAGAALAGGVAIGTNAGYWLEYALRGKEAADEHARNSLFAQTFGVGLPESARRGYVPSDAAAGQAVPGGTPGGALARDGTGAVPGIRSPSAAAAGSQQPALPRGEEDTRARQAIDYLTGQGWTRQQAEGITANLFKESGFREGAVGDGGHALGIAQWHEDRRAKLAAAGFKVEGASFLDQVKAVNFELTQGSEHYAGNMIRMAQNAGDAAAATSRYYERPGDQLGEMANRSRIGTEFDQRYGAAAGSSPRVAAGGQQQAAPIASPPAPPAAPVPSARAVPLPAAPAAPVPAAPAIPVPSASAGAQGAPGPNGRVAMHVQFSGAPAGTRMTASTEGDVSLSHQGLVDQAFPLLGGP